MNIREKLIELLREEARCPDEVNGCYECPYATNNADGCDEDTATADMLIRHGVVIQEWIPISNRLPTKKDTYDGDTILAVEKEYGIADPWSLESVLKYPQDFICWTQVPQPPKGE